MGRTINFDISAVGDTMRNPFWAHGAAHAPSIIPERTSKSSESFEVIFV